MRLMPGGRHGLLDSQNPALASFPSDKFFLPSAIPTVLRVDHIGRIIKPWHLLYINMSDMLVTTSTLHTWVIHPWTLYGSLVKHQESCISSKPLSNKTFCMVKSQEISIIVLTVSIIIVTIIVESEEACYVRTSTEKVVTGSWDEGG